LQQVKQTANCWSHNQQYYLLKTEITPAFRLLETLFKPKLQLQLAEKVLFLSKTAIYAIVAVIIIIIIIGAAAAYVLTNNNAATNPTATPTPSASQTPGPSSTGNNIATASNLTFTAAVTMSGTTTNYDWTGQNIHSSTPILKVSFANYVYILDAGQQKAYESTNSGSTWITGNFTQDWISWSPQWSSYVDNLAHWSGSGNYQYTDATGASIVISNIAVNQPIPASTFAHS
jgi:hypothetical protein